MTARADRETHERARARMKKQMPTKRALEPLCHFCGEDQQHLVEPTTDGGRARRVVYHCSTCGKSWDERKPCDHGYLTGCPHCRNMKPLERAKSDGFWDGERWHVDAPYDY